MFRTVVVPLDGSQLAEKVLPYLRQVTKPAETTLILVSNIELRSYAFASDSPMVASRLLESIHREVQAYLGEQQKALARFGYHVYTETLKGDTAYRIVETADRVNADLIAMTTHGRTGFSRLALGSVADRVVRTTRLPVLLVRAAADAHEDEIHEILVPLDGSPLAEQALPVAQAIAQQMASSVLLVRAVEPLESEEIIELLGQQVGEKGVPAAWYDEAMTYLEETQQRLAQNSITNDYQVVVGSPAEAILHTATVEGCNLIVMCTHGRSGLSRWVYGSVASKVLHQADCPLLLVRGKEQK